MAVISVTQLQLRSPYYLLTFLEYANRAYDQSKQASGNIQTVVRSQTETAYWTLTAWDNEASMQIYMMADAHREAMPKLVEWSDEASFVNWNQDSSELPIWDIAEQRMAERGKFVSLKCPSKAHLRNQFSI